MARLCTSTATGDDSWTATSFLSAFVELVIAFLFLAGATITHFTSKFIKISDLHLPCFDLREAWTERQSNVRKYAFYNHLSKELCALSHYFLQRTCIEDRSASEQCSHSTTCSEQDLLSSVEPMRPNQQPFRCRRHRPQMLRNCFCHPYSDELNTEISDEATAWKSQTRWKNNGSLLNGDLFGRRSSSRRRLQKRSGKRKFCGLSLEGLPYADRVSDDNGIAGVEVEGTLLEREHSLKVFPEELIDYNALIREHERDGVMGSPQALGKLDGVQDPSLRDKSTQPLELRLQQSPLEPENVGDEREGSSEGGAQACGGGDIVEEVCTCALVVSSGISGTEEKIEQTAEDAGEKVEATFSDHDERADISTQTAGSVITGDGQPKGSGNESDDDTLKLKVKLTTEREALNRTYLELEKERIASASAACEAMALITGLQEGKAALQMEALQYQRIAEERAMFDEEAIVTMRDILLKREAEKLALEKEIELYRRKLLKDGLEAAEQSMEEHGVRDASMCEGGNEETPMLEYLRRKKDGHRERSMIAGGAMLVANEFCERGKTYAALRNQNLSSLSGETNLLKPFKSVNSDGSSSEGLAGPGGGMANHNPGVGDYSLKTVKDAYYEDQIDDLQASHQAGKFPLLKHHCVGEA